MKLLMIWVVVLFLHTAYAEQVPEWTYPISPEILANNNGYITLANKENLLDGKFAPKDLVTLKLRSVVADDELRKEAAEALGRMFEAAENDGYKLYVKSAYRSYSTQNTMYFSRLEKIGYDDELVAYPGASDHQTGLGVDVLNYEWTQKDGMNEKFARTEEAQWMAAHCHEFGFVVRYEADKEELTKIKYEPWHLRYVGEAVARYMEEKHFCLEEFTGDWQNYIAEYEQQGMTFNELLKHRSKPNDILVVDVSENGEEDYSMFY